MLTWINASLEWIMKLAYTQECERDKVFSWVG